MYALVAVLSAFCRVTHDVMSCISLSVSSSYRCVLFTATRQKNNLVYDASVARQYVRAIMKRSNRDETDATRRAEDNAP